MILDPNWFYSSIAQCAAAIIGLLGAILATKLQAQLLDAESLNRNLNSYFLQLETHLKQAIANTENDYPLVSQSSHLTSLKKYSTVKQFADVRNLRNYLRILKDHIPNEYFGHLQGCINFSHGFDSENEKIVSTTKLNMPIAIIVLLTWLSCFGLIIPLTYLSSQQDCSKFWTLLAFAFGIISFIIYLINETRKIYVIRVVSL